MLDLGGACELVFDSLCDTLFRHHVYLFTLCDIICLMVVRYDMCDTLLFIYVMVFSSYCLFPHLYSDTL
jgi:hypothetical protein